MVEITAQGRQTPPDWAVQQRELMSQMARAAAPFVAHSTRPDGTLKWRSKWTSMDGTDNAYEAFLSFPLFHLLGGGDEMLRLAHREYDAITWQFEQYGTVEREFVTGFDWFHASESYPYIFYLAMGDPAHHVNRTRALRYAAMYIGDDPLAPNWDSEHRMLRAPLNGSRGPRFQTYERDWNYHRPILSGYLAPYEDLPGADHTDPLFKADWTDDEVFERILAQINARMLRGDVPLNLSATSLVTNAYLHTGEEKYRDWVLDYLQAWVDRRDANNGIVPDNVGPSGRIGEMIDGKWWGGYYGWRWPHGARNIVEPALVAGSCALLMTGDLSWLDLCRSQMDLLWELRREEDGVMKVPARHGDQGWFDYRPPDPYLYIHLWYLSQSNEDRARLDERFPDRAGFQTLPPDWGASKAGICRPTAWFAHIEGRHPAYPGQVIDSTHGCMCQALDRLERDDTDPETRECYHFQNLNPVVPEALVQMTMGTPAAIYNGGLLQAHVRYFDPLRQSAGLPDRVAAMVDGVASDCISLTLVNTDLLEERDVVLQSGSFAEHAFTQVRVKGKDEEEPLKVEGRHLKVRLKPGAQVGLHLGLERFVHRPTYAFPTFT
jgi:hypothetical protein